MGSEFHRGLAENDLPDGARRFGRGFLGGAGGRPSPLPPKVQKSAQAIENKGARFGNGAKKSRKLQKSGQVVEKRGAGFAFWGRT
jgi:hypothetical protein